MSHIKKLGFSLYIIAVLFGMNVSVSVVHACSCAQATETEQFDNAAAVFSGAVENVSNDGWSRSVVFLVDEVMKGNIDENVTVTTGMGDSDCGFDFEVGKSYQIYAYEEGGKLGTNICSGTYSLVQEYEDPTTKTSDNDANQASKTITYAGLALVSFIGGSLVTWLLLKRRK